MRIKFLSELLLKRFNREREIKFWDETSRRNVQSEQSGCDEADCNHGRSREIAGSTPILYDVFVVHLIVLIGIKVSIFAVQFLDI